jgi:hypothetical protein
MCLPYDACTAHVTIILFCSRMHKGWLCRSGPEDGGIDVRASLFVSKFHFSKLNVICFHERKGVLATRTLRWPAILYRLPLCHTRTSGGSSGHELMAVLGFSCESAVPARTDTHQTRTHARAYVSLWTCTRTRVHRKLICNTAGPWRAVLRSPSVPSLTCGWVPVCVCGHVPAVSES